MSNFSLRAYGTHSYPASWRLMPLGYVVRALGGLTPSKDAPAFWDGDVPWVTPKDMKADVITGSIDHVSERALQSTGLRLVLPPVVLTVVRGMILAHTVPIGLTSVPVTLNQDMKALIPGKCLDARFLGIALRASQDGLLALVEEAGHGTKKLRTDLWTKFMVPVPPLATQRAIADFLDKKTAAIDALIAKKERLIELLREKRQALITQAVTKGLDPNVPMKSSGVEWLGQIPAHWEVKRVKHVAKLESGHTPSRSNPDHWLDANKIPWVSLNDSKWLSDHDYIETTHYCINELGLQNSSARLLPPGVVVFTRDATIGKAAITTRPMAVSQHLIAWICGPAIEREFLLRVFYAMERYLERFTFGATIRTIGMDDVRSLVTPVPPVAEQRAIAEHVKARVRSIDAATNKVEAQLTAIREYRRALITEAVTGKLDIAQEADPDAEVVVGQALEAAP